MYRNTTILSSLGTKTPVFSIFDSLGLSGGGTTNNTPASGGRVDPILSPGAAPAPALQETSSSTQPPAEETSSKDGTRMAAAGGDKPADGTVSLSDIVSRMANDHGQAQRQEHGDGVTPPGGVNHLDLLTGLLQQKPETEAKDEFKGLPVDQLLPALAQLDFSSDIDLNAVAASMADPEKVTEGLQTLISGLSSNIMKAFLPLINAGANSAVQHAVQMAGNTTSQQMTEQAISTELRNRYNHLLTPATLPLVGALATQVAPHSRNATEAADAIARSLAALAGPGAETITSNPSGNQTDFGNILGR